MKYKFKNGCVSIPIEIVEEIGYEKSIVDNAEIEIIFFYRKDKNLISNQPSQEKAVRKVLKVLKDTGISKITVTFLDNNLKIKKHI